MVFKDANEKAEAMKRAVAEDLAAHKGQIDMARAEALSHLNAALAIIGGTWAEHVAVRTSRMADAVNLLERAISKLKLEIKAAKGRA